MAAAAAAAPTAAAAGKAAAAPRGRALLSRGGPTSDVIRAFPAWPYRNILFAHEAIRRDCLLMLDIIQPNTLLPNGKSTATPALVAAWKVRNFFKWFEFFTEMLHVHHESEEKFHFPKLTAAITGANGPAADALPASFCDGHTELVKLLNDMADTQQLFDVTREDVKQNGHAHAVQTLYAQAEALHDLLWEHLADEERVLPPLYVKYMAERSELATMAPMMQHFGVKRLSPMSFSWILCGMKHWASNDQINAFLKRLPNYYSDQIPRLMTAYDRRVLPLLLSLELAADPHIPERPPPKAPAAAAGGGGATAAWQSALPDAEDTAGAITSTTASNTVRPLGAAAMAVTSPAALHSKL